MNKYLKMCTLIATSLLCGCENPESVSSSSSESSTIEEPHVCEKPRLDLYILSGQSNMVGYSPVSGLSQEDKDHKYKSGWYYVKGEGKENHTGNRYETWTDVLRADYFGCSSQYFGPEVGFSKFMEDKYIPDEKDNRSMAMLKYSQGGSAMYNRWFSSTIYEKENGEQLLIDAAGNSCPNCTLDGKVVGDLYYNLVTTVREQIEFLSQSYCVHVIGLIWNQGCHDAVNDHAYYYEENLTDFISDFRRDINQPDLPVVIMQVFEHIVGTTHPDIVRQAQANVASKDDNVVLIDTSEGSGYSSLNPQAADPHHSSESMLKLGYEEAKALYAFKENR